MRVPSPPGGTVDAGDGRHSSTTPPPSPSRAFPTGARSPARSRDLPVTRGHPHADSRLLLLPGSRLCRCRPGGLPAHVISTSACTERPRAHRAPSRRARRGRGDRPRERRGLRTLRQPPARAPGPAAALREDRGAERGEDHPLRPRDGRHRPRRLGRRRRGHARRLPRRERPPQQRPQREGHVHPHLRTAHSRTEGPHRRRLERGRQGRPRVQGGGQQPHRSSRAPARRRRSPC